jgi:hypothetical protein
MMGYGKSVSLTSGLGEAMRLKPDFDGSSDAGRLLVVLRF